MPAIKKTARILSIALVVMVVVFLGGAVGLGVGAGFAGDVGVAGIVLIMSAVTLGVISALRTRKASAATIQDL